MKQDISSWTLIFDIIRAGLARRSDDVARTTEELAERVEHPHIGAGEPQIAKRLRRILAEVPQFSTGSGSSLGGRVPPGTVNGGSGTFVAFTGGSGPVDSESRSPFVDEVMVSETERPILPEMATAELERFVALQRHRDDLVRAGLPASRALLLYGPPGCGKTTAARYVAAALHLPLLTVRLDAVISSYLGTTAKNLRTVFDYAGRRRGILFLDEFDAVAKMRDDANEVGEIKRVVNGLIQNLDTYPDMPLIAATNHEHLLDSAIWRRFDSVIALPLPGESQREVLLRQFVRQTSPGGVEEDFAFHPTPAATHGSKVASGKMLRAASVDPAIAPPPRAIGASRRTERRAAPELDDETFSVLAQLTDGCSGADLERFVVRARQEMVLAILRSLPDLGGRGSFVTRLVMEIWRMLGSFEVPSSDGHAVDAARPALVNFVDRKTNERPSARVVSTLTGIPASTVARIRQQRDESQQERDREW